MKYVVNEVSFGKFPHVNQSVGTQTFEQAVDVAAKLAMRQQNSDSEEQVRKQLDLDGYYLPTKPDDWSVCINEILDELISKT